MYKIGDLLPLRELDDGVGHLILDSDELYTIEERLNLPDPGFVTGAVVYTQNAEYMGVWVTEYRQPWSHSAIYRKVL